MAPLFWVIRKNKILANPVPNMANVAIAPKLFHPSGCSVMIPYGVVMKTSKQGMEAIAIDMELMTGAGKCRNLLPTVFTLIPYNIVAPMTSKA